VRTNIGSGGYGGGWGEYVSKRSARGWETGMDVVLQASKISTERNSSGVIGGSYGDCSTTVAREDGRCDASNTNAGGNSDSTVGHGRRRNGRNRPALLF
jgi:hypothetical protein